MLRRPDLFGLGQRFVSGIRIPTQHVAGAGDVEQHRGEPVADRVVDIPRDPSALLEHALIGERRPRRGQFGGELELSLADPADHEGEQDSHDPHPGRRVVVGQHPQRC